MIEARGSRVCRVHMAQCLVHTASLGTMLDRLPKQRRDAAISDIYVRRKGSRSSRACVHTWKKEQPSECGACFHVSELAQAA